MDCEPQLIPIPILHQFVGQPRQRPIPRFSSMIKTRDTFSYLGSIISMDREIEEDVEHRIRTGWFKWRLSSQVLCDRCIPTRLKKKFTQRLDQL